ncbi:MAG: hypothetical protein sL5_01190 [Candidatus Mesenet longicola]|uniref:Phage tail tube protein n=1 Tax=Candidatus Mesenet longicola TaxID=1892558 RepID=A0A8J3HVM2_9RICK|nr:MAG: hypothetical protein sGL2_01170 [Candidatus Mesenet longicola]GHM59126.1 MAG: hypothetical protein sL5_01190 [Candidatus Mesenet longicola]
MIEFKVKDQNGNFVTLKSVKNLRLTLRTKAEEENNVFSLGWKQTLSYSGTKYITIKVNGVLDCKVADKLLCKYAFANAVSDYEISFSSSGEKISLQCLIELYERYYDPSNFDSFTLTLVSAGVVNLKTI